MHFEVTKYGTSTKWLAATGKDVGFYSRCVFYYGPILDHITYNVGLGTQSPERSDLGLNPARGHLLHVLPSISHTFLSIIHL